MNMVCLLLMIVLCFKKRVNRSLEIRKRSWQDRSMASDSWLTAVDKVSREKHKNCLPTSDLPHQAAPQEHEEATCPFGIRRKRCNVSSRRRATKWSLRFYFKPSTQMMSWRSGTNRQPFSLSTRTNVTAFNDQCILLITLSLAQKSADGSSVSRRKS